LGFQLTKVRFNRAQLNLTFILWFHLGRAKDSEKCW
jgi:hypothetical protein